MKNIFKIALLLSLVATTLFANPFTQPLEKVSELLENEVVKAIAALLIAICGFYVSSGQFDKGKIYAWGIIIGVSLVFGAKWLTDFIWG